MRFRFSLIARPLGGQSLKGVYGTPSDATRPLQAICHWLNACLLPPFARACVCAQHPASKLYQKHVKEPVTVWASMGQMAQAKPEVLRSQRSWTAHGRPWEPKPSSHHTGSIIWSRVGITIRGYNVVCDLSIGEGLENPLLGDQSDLMRMHCDCVQVKKVYHGWRDRILKCAI